MPIVLSEDQLDTRVQLKSEQVEDCNIIVLPLWDRDAVILISNIYDQKTHSYRPEGYHRLHGALTSYRVNFDDGKRIWVTSEYQKDNGEITLVHRYFDPEVEREGNTHLLSFTRTDYQQQHYDILPGFRFHPDIVRKSWLLFQP